MTNTEIVKSLIDALGLIKAGAEQAEKALWHLARPMPSDDYEALANNEGVQP